MTTAILPAWCDPTLSREERIAAVEMDYPIGDGHERIVCQSCAFNNGGFFLTSDRYGCSIKVNECRRCSLSWLAHRPTAEWYADFYASGTYRKLVSAFHGRDVMLTIEDEQREYGERLYGRIDKHFVSLSDNTLPILLDVGGSTGCVSDSWRKRYWRCDILDPAKESTVEGAIQGSMEDFETTQRYDLVLLCQTIDHLLEPRACLEKIRGLLASDGLFFVDILDTDQEVAEKGWQQTLKIDHCTYLTDKSMRLLLAATGFEVIDSWESAKNHVGYLCNSMP